MIKGLLVIIILISGTHLSSNDLMEEVRTEAKDRGERVHFKIKRIHWKSLKNICTCGPAFCPKMNMKRALTIYAVRPIEGRSHAWSNNNCARSAIEIGAYRKTFSPLLKEELRYVFGRCGRYL